MNSRIYDVIVIGSGPAALTAAVYTARGAVSTLVVAGEAWGGQLMLTTLVENFPGFPQGIQGPDLMQAMRQQAERFGAKISNKNLTALNFKTKPFELFCGQEKYLAESVIIATGAATVWLDVPGVKELIGRGVSSCATCDAALFKGQKVAVVGGGDTACEEADYLTKYAAEVILIHRRDQLRAEAAMQKKVLNQSKIKILWNTEVVKVNGQEKVSSVTLINNQTQATTELPVEGLFIAIGHQPQSEIFKDQLEMDERGFIKIKSGHSQTSVPGVFVAGDVMDPYYKQAITAAGSGCAAALDTLKYLEENRAHV